MSAALQGSPWARPAAPQPPLVDLLGARWAMATEVTGVAWDGGRAGFALGDGSLAMARADWDGAATIKPREGGVEVTPATAPPPPVSRQRVHTDGCLSVAAAPGGGFLSGGKDGILARVDADGAVTELVRVAGHWIDVVASGRAGFSAGAAATMLHVVGPDGVAMVHLPAAATAMAFDATGTRLAVGHYRGVTLWSADDRDTRLLPTKGTPRSVAWSPDGAHVVAGLQENALHVWALSGGGDITWGGLAGQVRSVAFTGDGQFLASSGGAQVACWRFDPPAAEQAPIECGLPASRMPVCRVACHPHRPLIAAGYQNGAVLLCQPGTDEVLFARASGLTGEQTQGAAITALAWSDDGARLAMGTAGGDIGVVTLPEQLFRFTPSRRIAS